SRRRCPQLTLESLTATASELAQGSHDSCGSSTPERAAKVEARTDPTFRLVQVAQRREHKRISTAIGADARVSQEGPQRRLHLQVRRRDLSQLPQMSIYAWQHCMVELECRRVVLAGEEHPADPPARISDDLGRSVPPGDALVVDDTDYRQAVFFRVAMK